MSAVSRVRLHREVAGDGPPVVFLHAGICDSRMWDPQWETFQSSGHRVVRCDLRGFGRSPLAPGRYSHPGDLIELLDELELGPTALVGASLGGGVALQVAVARPDLVSALVLVGAGVRGHEWSEYVTNAWQQEEEALERRDLDTAVEINLRTWVDGPHRSADAVDAAVRTRVADMQRLACEHWLAGQEDADEEALVPDVADRLGEISTPALVIVGEQDVEDVHAVAERLVRALPNVRVARIAKTAHLPSLERPREFDELVLGFLDEVAER